MENQVYILECSCCDIVKVGFTTGGADARARHYSICTNNKYGTNHNFTVSYLKDVKSYDGRKLEIAIHEKFSDVRVPNTEMFQTSLDEVLEVLIAIDRWLEKEPENAKMTGKRIAKLYD